MTVVFRRAEHHRPLPTDNDQQLVITFIDALVTKTRLKTLASGIN